MKLIMPGKYVKVAITDSHTRTLNYSRKEGGANLAFYVLEF